jgi:hypothetical protein
MIINAIWIYKIQSKWSKTYSNNINTTTIFILSNSDHILWTPLSNILTGIRVLSCISSTPSLSIDFKSYSTTSIFFYSLETFLKISLSLTGATFSSFLMNYTYYESWDKPFYSSPIVSIFYKVSTLVTILTKSLCIFSSGIT